MSSFVIYQYTLPFDPPFSERSGFLLHLTDGQSQGWGEIAPFPERSRETLTEALDQLLYVLEHPNAPHPPLFPSVAFGLFTAKHYKACENPLPLCTLLAGDLDGILSKAEAAISQGYTCAKIKISNQSVSAACDLIERLSAHFSLRIDANRAFSFTQAMQLAEHCQSLKNIEYIEEPTYELDALNRFSYPFALDESLLELLQLPINPHFQALIFKPSVLFGTEHLSEIKTKKCILSSCCETGVGILGIANLVSSLSLKIEPLGLDTYRFLPQDVLSCPLDFSSGRLMLPRSIEVNTQRLKEIAHG